MYSFFTDGIQYIFSDTLRMCVSVCQRCSEVEYLQAYNTITPLPQHSPPAPWYRSLRVTVTLCRATPGTALRDQDSRPEVLTCRALCPCYCELNHTQLAVRTRRRGMAVVSVSLHRRRQTTSWALRTSASSLPGYCLVLSSGPEIYPSFPTYRHDIYAHFFIHYKLLYIGLN